MLQESDACVSDVTPRRCVCFRRVAPVSTNDGHGLRAADCVGLQPGRRDVRSLPGRQKTVARQRGVYVRWPVSYTYM